MHDPALPSLFLTPRALSLVKDWRQSMGTQPHMFLLQWITDERDWRKKQGIRCIKQGSDRNHTKIGGAKLTDIDYNTVSPFYI